MKPTNAAKTLGRLGGLAKSEAKTLAARKNAKRPRPRKNHKSKVNEQKQREVRLPHAD